MALLVLLFAVFVYFVSFSEKDGFFLEKYANADAKFYNEYIITSVDEGVCILDFDGKVVKSYDGLKASWMYTYPEEGLIVYSNHDNETHLLRLDENMDLISDEVIITSKLLAIDPTISKVGDTYLVTHTTIEGTINNPDPNGDNGIYSLELFSSKDLKNWEHRTTITSQKQDIEDIDMMLDNKRLDDGVRLYCFYEKENYDKGPSAICMRYSVDTGMTWSEEHILIENVADNEMACMLPQYDGWRLYYSSDYADTGASYNGASAYFADFDADFKQLSNYQKVDMKDNYGVRLYEVKEQNNRLYFMYSHNYSTDKNFILRSIEKNDEKSKSHRLV